MTQLQAIAPRGVGRPVGVRRIREGWPLAEGESFTVGGDVDARSMVLAEDETSLREPTAAETLPSAAAAKRAAIHAEGSRRYLALIPTYPGHERESWAQQAAEADAYQADAAAATPLLGAMSSARGVTKAHLVAKVLDKRAAFAAAGGAVLGAQQALEDRLEAALAQYDADGDAEAARAAIDAIDERDPGNWP